MVTSKSIEHLTKEKSSSSSPVIPNKLKIYQLLKKICGSLKVDRVSKEQFVSYVKHKTLLCHQQNLTDQDLKILAEKLSHKK